MRDSRSRVMAGLAGATLCLFAITASAQNPTTTTTDPNAQAAGAVTTPAPATAPTNQATTPTATNQTAVSPTTATDVAPATPASRGFPGGTLGILAVAVLVLLVLFGLFRGRERTILKETYASTPAAPSTRTVTPGITADDRMNLNSRAASGPGSSPGGISDPDARR